MSVRNQVCIFQMIAHSDGRRSDPFTMSVGKLCDHFLSLEHIQEVESDFVLAIMDFGVLDPEVTDYTAFAQQSVFSKKPLITVRQFIDSFGEK